MNLYLMRHGAALAAADTQAASDFGRPLNHKGVKRLRRAGRGLRRLEIRFDAILTSPLLRARQTAEIIAARIDQESIVEELAELSPDGSVERLLSVLARYRDRQHVLLVGHEPLLSKTIETLLGSGQELAVELGKGSLCRIEVDDLPPTGRATLHWLLAPKHLRLIGA